MRSMLLPVLVVASAALALSACGGDDSTTQTPPPEPGVAEPADAASPAASSPQRFPDVVEATVARGSDNSFRFDVTISSPYDTPERYADAWRVLDLDGTVYGTRELLHDHAGEQPFTRSLDGVDIPDDVEVVIVEGRDLVNGWGGKTLEIELPRDER